MGRRLNRNLNEQEVQASTDFTVMETTYNDAVESLVSQWIEQVKSAQVDELAAAIASVPADSLTALASVQATPLGQVILADAMVAVARGSVTNAVAEAAAQGVTIEVPDLTDLNARLTARAAALDTLMARSISETAGRVALSESGGSLTPAEIAEQVREHLDSLTDTYVRDQLGGAVMQAQNSAR